MINANKYNSKIYSMQTNLVQNPGFETPDTLNPTMPANWISFASGTLQQFLYPVTPGRDGIGKCVGISYPTIEVGQFAGFRTDWNNLIPIDPTKRYDLSGYVKTSNIVSTTNGVMMYLIWRDINKSYITVDPLFESLTFPTDWIPFSIKSLIPVSNAAVYAQIEFYLNDCSGTAWFDDISLTESSTLIGQNLSGNGNDLAIHGTTTIPGKIGTGLQFYTVNGVDYIADYAKTNISPSFSSPTGTVSMWILPTSYIMGTLFHLYDNTTTIVKSGCSDYMRCQLFPDGKLNLLIKQNDIIQVDLELYNAYIQGQWYHIAWTQDGTGIKLYINGEDKTSLLSGVNSGLWWTNHLNQINTDFGIKSSGCGWGPYQGSIVIDEISIWNVGLSPSKVAILYNNGSGAILNPAIETSLKGYWRFEDGSLCSKPSPNFVII